MSTPNNAAAAVERLELISREMRERRVNHGKHTSPTLVAWAARIDAELATLRATLAQPDALIGGDKRLTACIEGIGLAKMALIAGDPVKARERLDAISDRLDALTVRIAHKGPADFPNHQCPAESSAVWNACCMEHERVLAGKVPMLTTTALTSQPSGEAVAEVGPNWTIVWRGSDSIASIARRYGLSVGSHLYTHPSADASVEAVAWISEAQLASLHAWPQMSRTLRQARLRATKCGDSTIPLYPHPSTDAPRINIKCEVVDNGIIGTTTLNVVRVCPEDDGSFTAVTDHWPYDAPGVAVANLYAAASKGFHTSETCGLDGKYMHVIKFRSMADLHAYEAAWRAAMIYVRDAALAPKPEGGHAD